MAILYDPRYRALDASGNPISGATLTVYTTGTTTPAAIWRDSGLTVPMTNPTTGADKSDVNGWFPVIYAAEAVTFDVILKDASGVTIKESDAVVSLGANTGAIVRDFTTSRFGARGAGGVTYVEAGDPVGDDVGGTGQLGGWNGTQADAWNINALAVNVIGGRIKEQAYKLDGTVRQEAITFSGAAFVAIPLTNDPTGVRMFEVDIIDLQSTNTGSQNWGLTFSYDGGGTYAASGYVYQINWAYGTTNGATGGTGASGLIVTGTYGVANVPAVIRLSIVTPNSGNNATMAMGQAVSQNFVGSETMTSNFSVAGATTAGRATHIKLTSTAGNLSGVYRVRPLRGLGET